MFILLLVIWYIFNGKVNLEITCFGLVLSALIYLFMCKFMNFSIKRDISFLKKTGLGLQYIGVLFIEIVKANLAALRLINSSKVEIQPVIVHFTPELKTKIARVVLANSITLTPGTITVGLEEEEFTVHCLDRELAIGMADSVFVKLLRKMEDMES